MSLNWSALLMPTCRSWLPKVTAKGMVAPGHRLQQGGNGLGHSGLQLFFGLALIGHAVALDLVAGVDDQIRVLRLNRRVQQCRVSGEMAGISCISVICMIFKVPSDLNCIAFPPTVNDF